MRRAPRIASRSCSAPAQRSFRGVDPFLAPSRAGPGVLQGRLLFDLDRRFCHLLSMTTRRDIGKSHMFEPWMHSTHFTRTWRWRSM